MHSRIFVITKEKDKKDFSLSEDGARSVNPDIDYIIEEGEDCFERSLEWLTSSYKNDLIINKKEKTWTITKETPVIYFARKYNEFLDELKRMGDLANVITLERYSGVDVTGKGDFEYQDYVLNSLYDDKGAFIIFLADEGYCVSMDYFIRNIEYYTDPEKNPVYYIIGSYDYHY